MRRMVSLVVYTKTFARKKPLEIKKKGSRWIDQKMEAHGKPPLSKMPVNLKKYLWAMFDLSFLNSHDSSRYEANHT
jgi:hypothetical protein